MKKFLLLASSLLSLCCFGNSSEKLASAPFVLILLGPPGAGKGTHAVSLSKTLNLPHISTGDLFREHLRNQTELGKKAKTFMDLGKLVPDELVMSMLFERLSQKDCSKGYILDGFPRTLPQAEALDHYLKKEKVLVIHLKVEDRALIERITGRIMCKSCKAPYHKKFFPPKKEGVCDQCEGVLYQRDDDKEDLLKERLKAYHAQTAPLIDFYQKKNLLKEIDSSFGKEEVFRQLLKAISKS